MRILNSVNELIYLKGYFIKNVCVRGRLWVEMYRECERTRQQLNVSGRRGKMWKALWRLILFLIEFSYRNYWKKCFYWFSTRLNGVVYLQSVLINIWEIFLCCCCFFTLNLIFSLEIQWNEVKTENFYFLCLIFRAFRLL